MRRARALAMLMLFGRYMAKPTRTALILTIIAGCTSRQEQCLNAADVHKIEAAHHFCHGHTWGPSDAGAGQCAPALRQAINDSYHAEQEACYEPSH